jgi:hypothetical protein
LPDAGRDYTDRQRLNSILTFSWCLRVFVANIGDFKIEKLKVSISVKWQAGLSVDVYLLVEK